MDNTYVTFRLDPNAEPKLQPLQHFYISSIEPVDGALEVKAQTIDLRPEGLVNRLAKMIKEELNDRQMYEDEDVADALFHVRALQRLIGLIMIREYQDREHERRMAELKGQSNG